MVGWWCGGWRNLEIMLTQLNCNCLLELSLAKKRLFTAGVQSRPPGPPEVPGVFHSQHNSKWILKLYRAKEFLTSSSKEDDFLTDLSMLIKLMTENSFLLSYQYSSSHFSSSPHFLETPLLFRGGASQHLVLSFLSFIHSFCHR